MKNKLLIALLFLTTTSVIAQVTYEKRIEFELKDGYTNESLIEFGSAGFLISSKKDQSSNNNTQWKYELFNTNLESVKSRKVVLNRKFYSDETYTSDEKTHTLYKNKKGNFSIVSVEASSLEIIKINGVVPKKLWIKEMAILRDYAFFNASLKRKPFIFSVNWKTGTKRLIPINIKGYNSKKITVVNFQVLEKSNEIFVFVKVPVAKAKSDIYIIRLNDQGKKVEVFNLSKNINQNIITVSASGIGDGKYIFTGTYSTTNTFTSEGLFFCQGQKSKIDFIKIYSFMDLKDFLSYLPKKKQDKIQKKKKKKQSKGKELKINYRIADHNVILLNDGYLFLGEAYYPTYRTETYQTTSTVNGVTSTTTHTRTVFDGYHYTHAVIAKFDKEGNLKWDKSFEMRPAYKPFHVKRFISIAEKKQNSIKLVFASRNKIVTKSIGFDGSVIQEAETEEIKTGYTGDKAKYTFSNIDYWYDNYFIAYGSQTIKNKGDKNVKRKRKVYFISKVGFE